MTNLKRKRNLNDQLVVVQKYLRKKEFFALKNSGSFEPEFFIRTYKYLVNINTLMP